jgi:hypothetical protein
VTAHLEDLVRAAQERQAERAPHPDRIRSALPARAARLARRRRYGAATAVAAAVAVATAVTVPTLALRGGGGAGPQPAAPPSATVAESPAVPVLAPVGLRFRPTWLPDGLAERIRRVSGGGTDLVGAVGGEATGAVSRIWTPGPVGTDGHGGSTGLTLDARAATAADDPQANTGKPVDVNGERGYYHGSRGDQKSYLEWRADAGTVVTIDEHRLGLTESEMVRIARSVRPDPARVQVPLTLGWLPGDLVPLGGEISGDSPTAWLAQLAAVTAPAAGEAAPATPPSGKETKEEPRTITVSLSPTTTAPAGGEQVTVGGCPGRLVTRRDLPGANMLYLVVDLGEGRLLTVIGSWPTANPLTRDDLIRVAANATPGDAGAAAWIGTR